MELKKNPVKLERWIVECALILMLVLLFLFKYVKGENF